MKHHELLRTYLDEVEADRTNASWFDWKRYALGTPVVLGMAFNACGGDIEQAGAGGSEGNCAFGDSSCASDCVDGVDNDEDGLIDCAEPSCSSLPVCSSDGGTGGEYGLLYGVPYTGGMGGLYGVPWENCDDGYDNDGDGRIDCDDSDCYCAQGGTGATGGVPTGGVGTGATGGVPTGGAGTGAAGGAAGEPPAMNGGVSGTTNNAVLYGAPFGGEGGGGAGGMVGGRYAIPF